MTEKEQQPKSGNLTKKKETREHSREDGLHAIKKTLHTTII